MTIAEMVLEKLRQLPPDRQKAVLEFLESLEHEADTSSGKQSSPLSFTPGQSLHSLEGLWQDFGIEISDEDIAEARREMWSNFP